MNSSTLTPNSTSTTMPIVAINMTSVPATTRTRILGAIAYSLMATFSLFANLMLMVVLVKGNRQFKHSSFFTIAGQLMVCDFLSLLAQFALIIPETWAGRQLYADWWVYTLGGVDTLAYNSSCLFALLLTVNRVCIFILPRYEHFFQRPRIYVPMLMIWLFILVFTVGLNLSGCYKNFSTQGFYLFYDDPDGRGDELSTMAEVFSVIRDVLIHNSSTLMILLYLIIFAKMKFSGIGWRKMVCGKSNVVTVMVGSHGPTNPVSVMTSKRERSFLIQSFIVCGVFQVDNIAFTVFPSLIKDKTSQWQYAMNFLTNCMILLFNGIHSIVIFTFNSRVREQWRSVVRQLCKGNVWGIFKDESRGNVAAGGGGGTATVGGNGGGLVVRMHQKKKPSIQMSTRL